MNCKLIIQDDCNDGLVDNVDDMSSKNAPNGNIYCLLFVEASGIAFNK